MEKKTRILVVEDNPDDQELLRHMLRKARLTADVEIAADGKAALDYLLLQHPKPDQLFAIFLDLNLPTITGLDLLKRIRADARLSHLAVVIMTSSNSPRDLKICQELRISSYIQKPILAPAFASAIAGIFHSTDDTTQTPRTY